MMETVGTFETSVNFNMTTRRYIPEDSKLLILTRPTNKNDLKYDLANQK
jgi:hypothetical protein